MPPWAPQKITQKSACFWCRFSTDFRPQNGPRNCSKSNSRGPQDALGATLLLEVVFGAMLGSFLVPRNLENRAPAAAGARFSEIKPLAWGAQNRAQNRPKIEPQTTPRGTKMAKKIESESMLIFKVDCKPKFNDFWTLKWAQKSIKNKSRRHKAAQRPPGVAQEAPKRPQEAPRRPPRGPQEAPRRAQKVPRQTPRTTSHKRTRQPAH